MKSSALASVPSAEETAGPRLRPVEEVRRGAKFAALDHDVARVLGPHRGAAVLYGFLASTWFEYADPQKLADRNADRKKKITPGDWVEVDYRQFMAIAGTNAKDSITRWLRILAEEQHACPWSRCADEHPLIVVQRQGRSRPNRYRKWRCGEDVLVIRPRVQSEKLKELAKQRVKAGQRLNGIVESPTSAIDTEPITPESQLPLLNAAQREALTETTEYVVDHDLKPYDKATHAVGTRPSAEALSQGNLSTADQASSGLTIRLHEAFPSNSQPPYDKASLREKSQNTDSVGSISRTAAKPERAAAIEEIDEVDAVACEVVDAVLMLAQRIEPEYPDDRAWAVARQLAIAALEQTAGIPATARGALIRAIADRRLARAKNPIGLLIRGVVGDERGTDRYLLTSSSPAARVERTADSGAPSYDTSTGLPPGLHSALLEALRERRTITDTWLAEREIPRQALAIARADIDAEAKHLKSGTPLCDKLEADDPVAYRAQLERILAELELPAVLRVEPRLEHPMLFGMCRARLEAELQTTSASDVKRG